mgnify:FL=1
MTGVQTCALPIYDIKKSKALMDKRSRDLGEKKFNTLGWLENQSLVVTLATLIETETWSNPNVLGPQLEKQYVTWGPLFDILIKTPAKLTYHTLGAITGRSDARYTRNIGPYWFQKKGAAKVWNDIFSMFGLSGNTVSPKKQVESLHSVRQGKSVH